MVIPALIRARCGFTYNYGSTNNNGNVQSVSYLGGGLSYTQSFGYDALNRLTTSVESGGAWSQTNKYDRYGNRAIDMGGGNQSLYFNASNQITNAGYVYDPAGNLTNDGMQSLGYDGENKIKSVNGVSDVYRYDGDGNRVRKNFASGDKLRMVYSGSQLIAEYDLATGALKTEYIYGAKGLLATIEPGAGTRYTTSDHLGSPRVVTNASAGVVSRHDYMPFGEELGAGIGTRTVGMGFVVTDGTRHRFTSKERDLETGLDNFGARYYSSTQGRFNGPDPLYIEMKRLPYPQAWNLYAYTRNNPLKYIDDDGLDIAVKCKVEGDCAKTVDDLNNRKGSQFKTELKDGKLRIVGDVDEKKLSNSERALYNAIVSTKATGTLEVISSSDAIDFGYSALNNPQPIAGLNLVDRSDLNQLNNVPTVPGEIVAHEAIEAYGSASGSATPNFMLAHIFANKFFGDVVTSDAASFPMGDANATSARVTYNFRRLDTKVTVEKTFVTPQPAESVSKNWDRMRGSIRVVPPNQK